MRALVKVRSEFQRNGADVDFLRALALTHVMAAEVRRGRPCGRVPAQEGAE
jgi:hypothetical protein